MYRSLGNANFLPILTALVVGYFFLEPPWRWLILIPAAIIDFLDIFIWLRWRKRRSMTGTEKMIGRVGEVVSVDDGRVTVKLDGVLWKATADEEVHPGERVEITGADGIHLRVALVDSLRRGP